MASSSTSTPSGPPRPALRAARPKTEARSASDPLPSRGQKNSPNISDTAIETLIRQPPNAREGRASVYVMTATHNETPIVKIGFTTSVDQRIKRLEQTCHGIRFHRSTTDLHPPPIDLYYMTVEKLAHAELQHVRYSFDCACKTRHREYFSVDAATARHIVQRWTRFCEARPWEVAAAGQKLALKDQWRDCLAGWKEEHARAAAEEAAEEAATAVAADPKRRLARWDRFVNTPRWKWLWYDLRVWAEWLSRFWWQALFVVLCVIIRVLVRDRGWLARAAEGAMLMTIVSLGGFRCVAAEGMLEPLLKLAWTVAAAVLTEMPDDSMGKAIYQDVWADSGDEDDDMEAGDGRDDLDDRNSHGEGDDAGNTSDRDHSDNRDEEKNGEDDENREEEDNSDNGDERDSTSGEGGGS